MFFGQQRTFLFTSRLIFISYRPQKNTDFFLPKINVDSVHRVVGACCPSLRGKQEKEQEGEGCYIELVVNRQIVCIR